jgi:uncharacterized membrane protein YkgB
MSHEGTPWGGIGGIQRLADGYRGLRRTGEAIDARFRGWERRHGHRALRYSLAFVFFWFGITKPLAISPADAVVRPTLAATPILNELVSFQLFFGILGWWEALVGLGLLWRRTVRLAVACMCVQMAATFAPLFVIPGEAFRWWPLVPSAIGFYIVKNFALATAGLVVVTLDSEPLFGKRVREQGVLASVGDSIGERIGTARATGRGTFEAATSRLTVRSLQAGLAIVFCWSGVLMVSTSPVPGQWIASIVPGSLIANSVFIPLFGVLELAIGLYLLFPTGRTTHAAAYLSMGYVAVTMSPVVLNPGQVFASMPFEPTFEGVYLFKDLILVAGILTIDAYSNGSGIGDDVDTEETDRAEPDL